MTHIARTYQAGVPGPGHEPREAEGAQAAVLRHLLAAQRCHDLGARSWVYKTIEKMTKSFIRTPPPPPPKVPNPRTHLTWHTALPAASTASFPAPAATNSCMAAAASSLVGGREASSAA